MTNKASLTDARCSAIRRWKRTISWPHKFYQSYGDLVDLIAPIFALRLIWFSVVHGGQVTGPHFPTSPLRYFSGGCEFTSNRRSSRGRDESCTRELWIWPCGDVLMALEWLDFKFTLERLCVHTVTHLLQVTQRRKVGIGRTLYSVLVDLSYSKKCLLKVSPQVIDQTRRCLKFRVR